MPRLPELSARLEVLGFEREGREWVLPGHDVAFEAPGETLEPGDTAEPAELPSGRQIMVLSLEDLLLWRLREWLHWRAVSGFTRRRAFSSPNHSTPRGSDVARTKKG